MRYAPIDEHPYIVFFSQGDRCTPVFGPHPTTTDKLNFYWLYESFHSHVSITKQDRYLHLFVRDPKSIRFPYFRGGKNWEEVARYYFATKEGKDRNFRAGKVALVPEPPILRSPDTLVPDLIFDFETEGAEIATIIAPKEHAGMRCRLFTEEHVPIPFREVPEIVAILPHITQAFPSIALPQRSESDPAEASPR